MIIGVPKEIKLQEHRIGLTPDSVKVLTKKNHKSGTYRIYEAFKKLGKSDIELVMNLQGDEPLMNPNDIINLRNQMIKTESEVGTLASKILDKKL